MERVDRDVKLEAGGGFAHKLAGTGQHLLVGGLVEGKVRSFFVLFFILSWLKMIN